MDEDECVIVSRSQKLRNGLGVRADGHAVAGAAIPKGQKTKKLRPRCVTVCEWVRFLCALCACLTCASHQFCLRAECHSGCCDKTLYRFLAVST